MSAFDVDEFFEKIYDCDQPEQVDALFAGIKSLPEAERKSAVDQVEAYYVRVWREDTSNPENMAEFRTLVKTLERNKDHFASQFLEADLQPALVALGQTVLNIHRLKGDAADPVIKTFAAAAAKMSEAEYVTAVGQMKLMLSVDAALKPSMHARPNPFHRKPPTP